MGIFDTIWDSAKCLTGFHDWPEWSWKGCVGDRECKRCPYKQVLDKHNWLGWEDHEKEVCVQERECSTCGTKMRRLHHSWDVWKCESPTSEVQVRFCRRCPTGREVREPSIIIRVPNADLSNRMLAGMKMNALAPSKKDPHLLESFANQIAKEFDGGVEIGYQPATANDNFTYLTWDWDDDREGYMVVTWQGIRWN